MKKIALLLPALLIPSILLADYIYMFNNSVISASVTEITPGSVLYKNSVNAETALPRDLVEKIVYSSGDTANFYDIIRFRDGSQLSGRIIRKTDQFVEIDPAGTQSYDRITADRITALIYNKEQVVIAQNGEAVYDEIFFKDGRHIKGNRISVFPKYIEFQDEAGIKQTYGRDMIDRIIYHGSRTEYFTAEKSEPATEEKNRTPADVPTGPFIELECGWNGYTGAGGRFDYRILDNFSLNGGAGYGLWGFRFSGALRYYSDYPYGAGISLGAAYNSGGNYTAKYDTIDESGNIVSRNVEFKLEPVTCLNATLLYSWRINGSDKIYFEGGYSYALQKTKYRYSTDGGYDLTENSEDIMDFLSPGGIILTAGYAFAF